MSRISSKDELEPVLMLVPYFAPQTHAAMFRSHKLAKYLPEHGFRPVVVTTDINYLYNEDPGLLSELPGCVEVHRARYVEPTVRGVRMALGGRDRTFVSMKSAASPQPKTQPREVGGAGAPVRRRWSASQLVRLFGEWPDRYWTWSLAARRLSERLIREQNIRLLYTSAFPVSPLRAAQELKRRHGLAWVADFRDPVGYGQKSSVQGMLAGAMESNILARTMSSADSVTGLSESYGSIFFDLFKLPESRYRFIPTGLDQEYLEQGKEEPERRDSVFLYVGEIMPDQSPYAFLVMQRARQLNSGLMSRFKIEFVGRREINQTRVESLVSGIPGWSYELVFSDHMPQRDVYARARSAAACLLIPGRHRYWWTNFAKMVDYIALGVPVIADVPVVSEAHNELGRAGNGFFLTGEGVEKDAEALLGWVQEGFPVRSDHGYRARYTAREQASDFAKIFRSLLT